MSNEVSTLLEEYREEVKLYVWYSPSPFSFFSGKASPPKAAQHRVAAQVAWIRYQTEKKGKKQ